MAKSPSEKDYGNLQYVSPNLNFLEGLFMGYYTVVIIKGYIYIYI